MKKVLFIDRDGTLVIEPPDDQQLDSLEKLEFYPRVFQYLSKIALLGYELVMVTNQDGLGTESYPEATFWPVQNKIIRAFENEGIVFSDILIDKTLPEDHAPTRKPGTGMLKKYLEGKYDLAGSFVIGDRFTDMELAKNLGAKGIHISINNSDGNSDEIQVLKTADWKEIYEYLIRAERKTEIKRTTRETEIHVGLNLDGNGVSAIKTGIAFLDHMLEQMCRHGQLDLMVNVNGDLEIDEHHTIEDTALALGAAFKQALQNKMGLERYGFMLPMDDCLAQVAIDFSGRPWVVWETTFNREKIGGMPTEMFYHFFKSFSDTAKCNLNIKAEGKNEHHKIEAIFKAFGKAIKTAIRRDTEKMLLPTTKGKL